MWKYAAKNPALTLQQGFCIKWCPLHCVRISYYWKTVVCLWSYFCLISTHIRPFSCPWPCTCPYPCQYPCLCLCPYLCCCPCPCPCPCHVHVCLHCLVHVHVHVHIWVQGFSTMSLNQYQPGSRLGQSHFSPHFWCGGGDPPVTLACRRWGPTYVHSLLYTHTGLLGLSSPWSFTDVNVVEKPVTTSAG